MHDAIRCVKRRPGTLSSPLQPHRSARPVEGRLRGASWRLHSCGVRLARSVRSVKEPGEQSREVKEVGTAERFGLRLVEKALKAEVSVSLHQFWVHQ